MPLTDCGVGVGGAGSLPPFCSWQRWACCRGPTTQQVAVNVSCDNAVPYRVETYRTVIVDTGSNGVSVTVVY